VPASANLPLHHKVQKFSSGTGSPGWSGKNGCKMVVVWCGLPETLCVELQASDVLFSSLVLIKSAVI